ncbi:hypothetical protein ACFY71_40510 [Streptomyces cinerochromogenes]|uniref:hypothetical protein n=1 Tax=Streptomyces cinerochromogenes TaxID=66422 RepID=UPI0036CF9611
MAELDGFERGPGDAFGAVADGGDGCLADGAGEASDTAGGVLVGGRRRGGGCAGVNADAQKAAFEGDHPASSTAGGTTR